MKALFVSGDMKWLGWVAAGLGVWLLLSCSRQTYQKPEKSALGYYYRAEQYMQEENFPAALSYLDSALALNPRLTNLYRARGWVLERLNQPDAAIAAYRTFLQQRSGQPDIWLRLGELYAQTGHVAEARTFLQKVGEAFPDSAEIQFTLGQLYARIHLPDPARRHLEKYEKLVPQPVAAFWKWKGRVSLDLRDYDAAAAALERYASLHPHDPEAQKWLGMARFELGLYDEALSLLNQVEAESGSGAEIYLYRAKYFLKFGKPKAAREQLQVALAADSSVAAVWFELGQLDYREGRFSDAKTRLERTLQLDPEYWPAYRLLGFLAEQEGEYELAKQYYRRYLWHATDRDREVTERLEALSTRKK